MSSSSRHSRKDPYEQRSRSRPAARNSSRRSHDRSHDDEKSSRTDDEELVCCIHGVPCELNDKEDERKEKPERDAGEEEQVGNGYEPIALLPKVRVSRRSKNRGRSGSTNTDATNSLSVVTPGEGRKSKKPKDKNDGHRVSHSPTARAVEPTDGVNGNSPHAIKDVPPPKSNKRMVPDYDPLLQLYIGEWTKAEAERRCRQKASFAFYHRLPSKPVASYDDLTSSIPLFIVYCTSKGQHRHYPIRVRTCLSPDGSTKRQLTVVIPGEKAPYFNTLYALAHYYATYIHLQTGETSDYADVFPWWLEDDNYTEPKTESNVE